eukprot:SM000001S04744  [mRNA]  locus=s1:1964784:1967555:- [translate_table: standard]
MEGGQQSAAAAAAAAETAAAAAEATALEQELQEQVAEQRASIQELEASLGLDPAADAELQEVLEELRSALQASEEGLGKLRQVQDVRRPAGQAGKTATRKLVLWSHQSTDDDGCYDLDRIASHALTSTSGERVGKGSQRPLGSTCRFRHTDGRWYFGQRIDGGQVAMQGPRKARVTFLHPTTEAMLRCRFGDSCRQSHGIIVSEDHLEEYVPDDISAIPLGEIVLACTVPDGQGVWQKAELEWHSSKEDRYGVAFLADGRRMELQSTSIVSLASAEASSSTQDSGSDPEVEDSGEERLAIAAWTKVDVTLGGGSQTETAVFAEWEKYTRGVASKMMVAMGYTRGSGLGSRGQGIAAPLNIRVLPPRTALDFVGESTAPGRRGGPGKATDLEKRRKRGGERSRRRKFAEQEKVRRSKLRESNESDMFGIINQGLKGHFGNAAPISDEALRAKISTNKRPQQQQGDRTRASNEERQLLLAREDELRELRSQVSRLEDMERRNKNDKAMHSAVLRRLDAAQTSLSAAIGAHTSRRDAIHQKEQSKKWLKF